MRYVMLCVLAAVVACSGAQLGVNHPSAEPTIAGVLHKKDKPKREGIYEKLRHKSVMRQCRNGNC